MNVNILYTFGRTPKENYNLKDKVVWSKCACVCSAQQVLLYVRMAKNFMHDVHGFRWIRAEEIKAGSQEWVENLDKISRSLGLMKKRKTLLGQLCCCRVLLSLCCLFCSVYWLIVLCASLACFSVQAVYWENLFPID